MHPGEDAVEMTADHLGDILHRLDFGAQQVGAPGVQEPGDDGGLLAGQDVMQLFAIVPGTSGAGDGHAREQAVEFGGLGAYLDFCVLRHSMSAKKDMYATQDDEESPGPSIGAAA